MTRNLRTQVVDLAEHALRSWFGDDISREDAARVLPGWRFVGGLDDELRAEVLSRFSPAEPPSVPSVDYLPAPVIVRVGGLYRDSRGDIWAGREGGRLQLTYDNDPTWPLHSAEWVTEHFGPLVVVQPDAEQVQP